MCATPIVSAVPTAADFECVVSNYIENVILVKCNVTRFRSIDPAVSFATYNKEPFFRTILWVSWRVSTRAKYLVEVPQ